MKKTKEVEKLQFVERMRYKKHIRMAGININILMNKVIKMMWYDFLNLKR